MPVNATQSSVWGHNDVDQFGAGNCIDGGTCNDNSPHGLYAICHTDKVAAPWIAIDYGTSVTVQRVEIFNIGTRYGLRTRNLDIRISDELPTSADQMFSGGHLLGHFAGPATRSQHITISGQKQECDDHC